MSIIFRKLLTISSVLITSSVFAQGYPGGTGGGYGNYYGTWTQDDVIVTVFGKHETLLQQGQTGNLAAGISNSTTGKLGYVTASFSSPFPASGSIPENGRACDAMFTCKYNFNQGTGMMPPQMGITITNSSYSMSSGTVIGSAVIGNPYTGSTTELIPSGNWILHSSPKSYPIIGSSTAVTGAIPSGYIPPANSVGELSVGHVASGYSSTAMSMITSILANFTGPNT